VYQAREEAMKPRERLLAGMPVVESRRRLDGVSTAVLEGGEGAPIVLLHGPGEHATKWFRVIPDLVRSHRVIAPDLPGHGESAVIEGAVTRVIDWLDALIDATCPTPPALVGHIVGGAIGACFAAVRPGRLSRLVLADTLGLVPFNPAPEFGAALVAFLARPDETSHDELWRRCSRDLERLRHAIGERWSALRDYNLDRATAPQLKAFQQRLMETFGFPAIADETLRAIRVPTRLIWGRHDLATPVAVAQAAAGRYDWPLSVIEDCGDDPAMDQPEPFVRALRAALGERASVAAATSPSGAVRSAP
jgi:pimeloyl-ACP methyl ester carboxylesterase